MQGVSSNYPSAASVEGNGRYNLGEPSDDGDFYKAATDAASLDEIFSDIADSIGGTGYPTQVDGVNPSKDGYITFTDTLGDYMKVDSIKGVQFGDAYFTAQGETLEEQIFTGFTGGRGDNENYPEGNLENLVISVEPGKDLVSGDTVTVKIPANLLPLRQLNLTTTENDEGDALDITPVNPIRIFYGVSVKDGVVEPEKEGEPAGFVRRLHGGLRLFALKRWKGVLPEQQVARRR